MSKKPQDYIFAIVKQDGLGWCAAITPKKYFEKTGYMYDQHLPVIIPDWFDEMEGYYTPEVEFKTPEDMYVDLCSKGFVPDVTFMSFMSSGDGIDDVLDPAKSIKLQSGSIPSVVVSKKKVSTADCTKRIKDVLKQTHLVKYSNDEWKRSSKTKNLADGGEIRIFNSRNTMGLQATVADNSRDGIHTIKIHLNCVLLAEIPCRDDSDVQAWFIEQSDKIANAKKAQVKEGKYKYFALSTGYVESASIAQVMIRHNTGFETVEEGLGDFIACVRKVICEETSVGVEQIPLLDVLDYVERLFSQTTDGMEHWEQFQELGWSVPAFYDPDRNPSGVVVFVSEFLWNADDADLNNEILKFPEDAEKIRENESFHYGEWCEAELKWKKGKSFSKARTKYEKSRFPELNNDSNNPI